MRVLYLPIGDQPGTVDGFRNNGVELEVYDFWSHYQQTNKETVANELLDRVQRFQPDLLHMQLQLTGAVEPETIKSARDICPDMVVTNWSGDCREVACQQFTKLGKVVDYSLISNTGQLEMYRQAGCANIKYWQIGYDPTINYPLNYTQFQYDAVFMGNHYDCFPDSRLRLEVTEMLNKEPSCAVFGDYPGAVKSISIKQANEVYNRSVCPISISHFNNISHYFSDRLLHCLASGRPTICWYFPGCEDYFKEGKDIFYVHSKNDILDVVKFCKDNPKAANKVGITGAKKVLAEHIFTNRITELLEMI